MRCGNRRIPAVPAHPDGAVTGQIAIDRSPVNDIGDDVGKGGMPVVLGFTDVARFMP